MKGKPVYYRPATLKEAFSAATKHRDYSFIAGGTDLMVHRKQGNNTSTCLIDISRLKNMSGVRTSHKKLIIGAGTTLKALTKDKTILNKFPVIAEASSVIASPVIRESATIGGNLLCDTRCSFFNQSEFWRHAVGKCLKCGGDICIATGGPNACFSVLVSDLVPALICLNATVTYQTPEKPREIPLEDLYTGDGMKPVNLPSEALITKINVPMEEIPVTYFNKLRPRKSVDFTNLTLSASYFPASGVIKCSASGVDARPAVHSLQFNGKARGNHLEPFTKKLLKQCKIIENQYYPRRYRKAMVSEFLAEAWKKILPSN